MTVEKLGLPDALTAGTFEADFLWRNDGYAPCYEAMHAELALFDPATRQYVWQENQLLSPGDPRLWDAQKRVAVKIPYHLPSGIRAGRYELHLTVRLDKFHHEKMQLALAREYGNRTYVLGEISVK